MMTSNRPLEDWGKLIGDVPAATAILDRFLAHAEILTVSARSYRLRHHGRPDNETKKSSEGSKEPEEKPSKKPKPSPANPANPADTEHP